MGNHKIISSYMDGWWMRTGKAHLLRKSPLPAWVELGWVLTACNASYRAREFRLVSTMPHCLLCEKALTKVVTNG